MGRGLSALISEPQAQLSGRATYVEIPLEAIAVNPYQPRNNFDEAALNTLSASIAEVGVLQPVLVRQSSDGRYQLIAGERRCRAARKAGLTRVPAIVRSVKDSDALEQALLENLQREDLNPIEQALSFQHLIVEFRFTQETISKRLGKSRSAVANTLRLLQLPDQVQHMVAEGNLSAGHARALLGIADPNKLIKLAQKVVDEGLTVRMVEDAARHGNGQANSKSHTPRASSADRGATVLELENRLGDHFDTKVNVFLGKGQGKLVVHFADMGDLERIYTLMMQK